MGATWIKLKSAIDVIKDVHAGKRFDPVAYWQSTCVVLLAVATGELVPKIRPAPLNVATKEPVVPRDGGGGVKHWVSCANCRKMIEVIVHGTNPMLIPFDVMCNSCGSDLCCTGELVTFDGHQTYELRTSIAQPVS